MEELYSQAVGAVGIAPPFFYDMTPYEVTLAYKGFLKKMEIQGNVMLMAIRQQNVKKPKPIRLLEEEQKGKGNASVKKSTIEARNKTLAALGISK